MSMFQARFATAVLAAVSLIIANAHAGEQLTPLTMPANTWLEVPNTKMRAVCPPEGKYPVLPPGTSEPKYILAYSGGVLDTLRSRLIIWGGGHAGYAGNEIYAFDVKTLKWQRLTEPSPPTGGRDIAPDGNPASRHTYNGLAYIAHADRLFGLGGSVCGNGNAVCSNVWTFDFPTSKWHNMKPTGTKPSAGYECNASHDPVTKKVWWGNDNAASFRPNGPGLFSYDYPTNQWQQHDKDDYGYYISTIDTKRGLLILMSCAREKKRAKHLYVFDIRSEKPKRQEWQTTDGDEILGSSKPGLDYDPVADRIVGWTGRAVYALDPESKKWTKHDAPGGPARAPLGVYGRWRYVPSVNAFIAMHDVDKNVFFYKLPAAASPK